MFQNTDIKHLKHRIHSFPSVYMIYFRTLLIIMFIQGITKHSRDDPPHRGDSADDASPLPGFGAINTGSDDPPHPGTSRQNRRRRRQPPSRLRRNQHRQRRSPGNRRGHHPRNGQGAADATDRGRRDPPPPRPDLMAAIPEG